MERRYQVTLTGLSALIMHNDNLKFSDRLTAWRNDPACKHLSVPGDDRSPAFTWMGCLYNAETAKFLGMPADNIMTMLREGGAKVPFKGKETYKKQTQSGLIVNEQQFDLFVNDKPIPFSALKGLEENLNFQDHLDRVQELGFDLLVRRAVVNKSKHVRVRPMFFQGWTLQGSLIVFDEEVSGLKQDVLQTILNQAGSLCGLGDWRPSSPKGSGSFGRFKADIERIS